MKGLAAYWVCMKGIESIKVFNLPWYVYGWGRGGVLSISGGRGCWEQGSHGNPLVLTAGHLEHVQGAN